MTENQTSIQTESKRLGRKPINDKKKPITIYRNQSEIEKLGGLSKVRELLNELIQTKIKS